MKAREPLSCEPCRKRKIRCSQTVPPCDTCRRRRCSQSCVYAKTWETTRPLVVNDYGAHGSQQAHDDLLNRVRNLEGELLAQVDAQRKEHSSNASGLGQLSPDGLDASCDGSTAAARSSTSHSISPPSVTGSHERPGVLHTSESGSVRYEPRASQWSSVLDDAAVRNKLPSLQGVPHTIKKRASSFPFEPTALATKDDLLALLPPKQQCVYLKDTFISVFSSV